MNVHEINDLFFIKRFDGAGEAIYRLGQKEHRQ